MIIFFFNFFYLLLFHESIAGVKNPLFIYPNKPLLTFGRSTFGALSKHLKWNAFGKWLTVFSNLLL